MKTDDDDDEIYQNNIRVILTVFIEESVRVRRCRSFPENHGRHLYHVDSHVIEGAPTHFYKNNNNSTQINHTGEHEASFA